MEATRKTPRGNGGAPALKEYHGRRVTVMGLGLFGGGVAAARYFVAHGAHVTVTDLKTAASLAPSVKALEGLRITLHLGGHDPRDFTETDVVVVSPAVPKTSRFLRMAEQAGVGITSEMNLFLEACPAPIIGVTGSNGKSTTTGLLGAMLSPAGPTRVGGNIGKSLLEEVEAIRPEERVVLELSSFQLEDAARIGRSPHVAVVTCISENHLDRHGTMQAYIDAKKNVLRFQGASDWAVLNEDDAEVRTWGEEARGRVARYSARGPVERGVFAEGSTLVFRLGEGEERLDVGGRLRLRGRHNLSNVLAAATAARLLGATTEMIASAVGTFRALPHRLEPVGGKDGMVFIDDSKATTPLAARLAIEAFTEPVVLIAGGYDKHADPGPMVEAIRSGAKAVVLMGVTADALGAAIGEGATTVERAADMDDAVRRAVRLAGPGDVVLLSPGHASWDMFENYEDRGDQFRRAAERLGMKPLEADP